MPDLNFPVSHRLCGGETRPPEPRDPPVSEKSGGPIRGEMAHRPTEAGRGHSSQVIWHFGQCRPSSGVPQMKHSAAGATAVTGTAGGAATGRGGGGEEGAGSGSGAGGSGLGAGVGDAGGGSLGGVSGAFSTGREGPGVGAPPSSFSFLRNRLNRKTMPISRGGAGLYGSESPMLAVATPPSVGHRHTLLGATGMFPA
jgi:hypothetical protein